jgi:hypothetical protein
VLYTQDTIYKKCTYYFSDYWVSECRISNLAFRLSTLKTKENRRCQIKIFMCKNSENSVGCFSKKQLLFIRNRSTNE